MYPHVTKPATERRFHFAPCAFGQRLAFTGQACNG